MRDIVTAGLIAILAVLLVLSAQATTNAVALSTNIASGASSVSASWAALGSVPDRVLVTIQAPATNGAGSYRLFATPINSSLTTTGVLIHLSGTTDTTGYVAHVSIWE